MEYVSESAKKSVSSILNHLCGFSFSQTFIGRSVLDLLKEELRKADPALTEFL
jgi:hypothetical protein